MDNKACNSGQPVAKKGKKKQVKGELDPVKQAEKKRRRLEKALATSAAIRAELEKKKLKKKEEQQRLDEEGAAIAEAVAMHVLVGDDIDDGYNTELNRDEGLKPWGFATGDTGLFMGSGKANLQLLETPKYLPIGQLPYYQRVQAQQASKGTPMAKFSTCQKANREATTSSPIGKLKNAYVSGCSLDGYGQSDWSNPSLPRGRKHYTPYSEAQGLGVPSLHNGLQGMHI